MKKLLIIIAIGSGVISTSSLAYDTSAKWNWFANSYWYVPTKNLTAYEYTPGTNTISEVNDQTVFQITNYVNGYFWGKVVSQLGTGVPACNSLVGSVTPEGNVYLTFTPNPYSDGESVTYGFGKMVLKNRQWMMVNQMSAGPSGYQIGHWAYMVQTKQGQASWLSLPGISVSVKTFLDNCPSGPS